MIETYVANTDAVFVERSAYGKSLGKREVRALLKASLWEESRDTPQWMARLSD